MNLFYRFSLFLLALSLLLPAFANTDSEARQRRVALVIGNGSYDNIPALPNAVNDGRDIAAVLRNLDFEVVSGLNLNYSEMRKLIRDFQNRLQGAEVGLFYYAGHGIQVNDRNYLLPVDAALNQEGDLDFETIEMNLVLKQLERESTINLVFLDACRDNPLAARLSASGSRSLSVDRGLGQVQVQSRGGTLIAFATAPDQVAQDGDGDNSPFTQALLQNIATPNLKIEELLKQVARQVKDATANKQEPWWHSSITEDFYFNPVTVTEQAPPIEQQLAMVAAESNARPRALLPNPAARSADIELEFWEMVTELDSSAAYKAYIDKYPNGEFTALAEQKLVLLNRPTKPAAPSVTTPPVASDHTPIPEQKPPTLAVSAAPDHAALENALGLTPQRQQYVQQALTVLGFDTRGVDGVLGPNSRRAITDFQRANGFAASGYLNAEQLQSLTNQARGPLARLARERAEAERLRQEEARRQAEEQRRIAAEQARVKAKQETERQAAAEQQRREAEQKLRDALANTPAPQPNPAPAPANKTETQMQAFLSKLDPKGRTESEQDVIGGRRVILKNPNDCVQGNCINGIGVYHFANGDRYRGAFKRGKMHGRGEYFNAKTGTRIAGQWSNGAANGNGVLYFSNGNKYIGQIRNGVMHGNGELHLDDGKIVKGRWNNGSFQPQ